jgi:hypothetical protein
MSNRNAGQQFTGGDAGMRAPGFGFAAPTATTTNGLPAALANLVNQSGNAAPMQGGGGGGGGAINMQALQMQPTGTVASNPNYPVLDFRMQPTYADGGMVGDDGMPMQGGMPMQAGMQPQGGQQVDMQSMQGEIQRVMQQNPQMVQQIQQEIMGALQSGQITMEQLNTALQLAQAAIQNPELYPRLRALAIQRGLADEDELPQQYDQGIVFAIMLAGAAAQQAAGGGGATANMPSQQLANGGQVQTFNEYFRPGFSMGGDIPMSMSPTGDKTGRADDVPIRVSGGEFVIPKHVVEAKGTEFFDKLLEQYSGKGKEKA